MIIRNITAALLCFLFVSTLAALEHNHNSNSNNDIVDSVLAVLEETDSTSNTKTTAEHFLTNHDSRKDSIGRELPQDDADEEYDPNSTTITNNVEWKDNNGDPLQNGRGGKLARIGQTWYWIGTQSSSTGIWFDGGTIYLYKSTSLGSNSWKFVRTIEMPEGQSTANCQIFQHPKLKTIHIFCKKRKFFKLEDGGTIADGNFILTRRQDPSDLNDSEWNWGNQNMFQFKDQMFMTVSRCRKVNGKCSFERKALIFMLNESWTNFAEENAVIAEWDWSNREAFHILRKRKWWYMFASETAGWKQSRTWYRKARSVKRLAEAPDREVVMHPSNTQKIKSMGTQFRFVQKVSRGRWLFGGSRHPIEDPTNFDPKYGTHVMTPLRFRRGVPHAYWKETFSWKSYVYKSGDHDEHDVDWYGPAPSPNGQP